MSNSDLASKKKPNRIYLDYPLDILLNRDCRLKDYEKIANRKFDEIKSEIGSLLLPSEDSPGSGNIVIKGRPGTGKSTLALQFAVACTYYPNAFSAIYFNLEETTDNVYKKTKDLLWDKKIKQVQYLNNISEFLEPYEIAKELQCIFSCPNDSCAMLKNSANISPDIETCNHFKDHVKKIEPVVLLPELTPRFIVPSNETKDDLFWIRYKQLEKILAGINKIRNNYNGDNNYWMQWPNIRMVCIDSLNAFGDRPLNRDELIMLFTLFKRNQIISVFTVEGNDVFDHIFSSELIDIFIQLSAEEDNGYHQRYFEIIKSRYHHQVYGKHPFRMRSRQEIEHEKNTKPVEQKTLHQVISIYPSIHHIVAATEPDEQNKQSDETSTEMPFDIGINNLVPFLHPTDLKRKSVVAITGEKGTFKTNIAQSFLLKGLYKSHFNKSETPESVLMIRLHEKTSFDPNYKNRWMFNSDMIEIKKKALSDNLAQKENLFYWNKMDNDKKGFFEENQTINSAKIIRKVYSFYDPVSEKQPKLIEIAFKSGAIFPEEFIEFVRDVYIKNSDINRVVLDDIALIGTSYPFLRQSKVAGDLFLPAFVHVMRNYGVDLVLVGTTGQCSASDEMVKKACTLADDVLRCSYCDVFGARYVVVTGERIGSGQTNTRQDTNENVPGVIIENKGESYFEVDLKKLQGLVGFDKGLIKRPGLVLNVFDEGPILQNYNKEIQTMIQSAFGNSLESDKDANNDIEKVTVNKFTSPFSEAVHDSLKILKAKPIDKTVLYTVDEFFLEDSGILHKMLETQLDSINRERFESLPDPLFAIPYYANVLLIAYNSDFIIDPPQIFKSWQEVFNWIDSKDNPANEVWPMDYVSGVPETMSCILIDAIVSGTGKIKIDKNMSSKEKDEFKGKEISERFKVLSEQTQYDPNMGKEIKALAELFSRSYSFTMKKALSQLFKKGETDITNKYKDSAKLNCNAAVYICWYSQLRELLCEHPELSTKLKVRPLPGSGFSGDWYLGIEKGSVSVNLGIDIVNILCSEKEEYKRYVRGVGLPVSKKYLSPKQQGIFKAWPLSEINLEDVLNIHKNALKRSSINGYQKFRTAIGALGEQLAFLKLDEKADTGKFYKERIKNIYEILQSFNK